MVCLGEDIGAAGGVFKTTVGLFDEFGPQRVWDTPISEQAIVGAAMGAAMTGMRPVAEIMFSDFLACCWDYLANEIPKVRYMTGGQVTVPLVIRTANGGGLGFGAQHSQAVENWALTVPGLKIAAPSTPADVIGLMAVGDPQRRPGGLLRAQGTVREQGPGRAAGPRGRRWARRPSCAQGTDVTLVALASTVPIALAAAERLAAEGISAEVVDLRCLVPLDMRHRAGLGRAAPRGWSSSRRTRTRAAGARPSSPSSPTRASSCSTRRSGGSPRPACRCRSPTRSRTQVIPTVDKVVDAVRTASPPTRVPTR